MTKKEIVLKILSEEIAEIRSMKPDEEENKITFSTRQSHYLAEAKAIRLRIFNELN